MSDITPAGNVSPFDALRRVDADGEFWSARDLMVPLGYSRWESFSDAIERAKIAACNAGHDCDTAFSGRPENVAGGGPQRANFRLTRFGAYLLAMNGDPRKVEVAAAQSYFAIKTREAELAAPRDSLDVLQGFLTRMIEERDERLALESRTRVLEAKVSAQAGEHNEFTTLAYAKLNNLPSDRVSCQRHGQRASRLMRSRGQEPRKRQDATFGTVNVYPVDVLEETDEH